eukprot:TRINITY_DN69279_c0_g1_i1.p1 TRINITY_DN69279_c0_g1~~TRINITY_DN69279_c0_g1_i1.p1  ORF type:complete len:591 (-),score=86.63 TRINITY_DN69279_c0_g1_i1:224-1996(-)
MASGYQTWQVADYQGQKRRLAPGGCLYGPELRLAGWLWELHIHPLKNTWPEPGALYLRLKREALEPYVEMLKVRLTFRVPEIDFTGTNTVRDDVHTWQGGVGPAEKVHELGAALADYRGEDLTVEVFVEVLEVKTQKYTVFRWPFEKFEDLKGYNRYEPCLAGFHVCLHNRFEVHSQDFGIVLFRADLHPNIDATGNLYLSFRLERAGREVGGLELRYDLEIEELSYKAASETLRGSAKEWSQNLGIAGHPTNCSALRKYVGPVTLCLRVEVHSHQQVDIRNPPVWTDFVSEDFRYLLLSAAGPDVAGEPEKLAGHGHWDGFAAACAWNIHKLQTFLLAHGVPAGQIVVADYSGEVEHPHPRELLEGWMRRPGTSAKLVVYFCGHADPETGAWCFRWLPAGQMYAADFVIRPQDLMSWRALLPPVPAKIPLEVIVETVGAGAWCVAAKEARLRGRVIAACAPGGNALALWDGSLFTEWIVGRGQGIKALQPPEGPQIPWECSRIGAVGPLRLEVQRRPPVFPPPINLSATAASDDSLMGTFAFASSPGSAASTRLPNTPIGDRPGTGSNRSPKTSKLLVATRNVGHATSC